MSQEPVHVDHPTALPEDEPTPEGSTRRLLLCGVGLAGLAGTLVACGGSDTGTLPAESSSDPGASSGPGETTKPGGAVLAKTSEIPVGGGKIFPDKKIVVTQPTKGQFEAFSATCSHRGCTVDQISGGVIQCPCHGSRYSITNASVVGGPAPAPLAKKKITVEGDQISVA